MPPHLLNEGEYRLDLMLGLHYREWIVEPGRNAPSITLSIRGGLSKSPFWMSRRPGMLAPVLEWEIAPRREPASSTDVDRPIMSGDPSQ
jgi:lipopolysaccharide transport system ATP-binding protein